MKSAIYKKSIPKNLHQLVDLAADNSIPTAVKRNSFIVNDVPREFQISSNEIIVATIVSNLLSTVVSHTQHSCIRIKAKVYGDIICLSIKDGSNFSGHTVTEELEQVKLLAGMLNGKIIIRNMEDKFTTILLSFPNHPIAA